MVFTMLFTNDLWRESCRRQHGIISCRLLTALIFISALLQQLVDLKSTRLGLPGDIERNG